MELYKFAIYVYVLGCIFSLLKEPASLK